jgi:hypothetical protein
VALGEVGARKEADRIYPGCAPGEGRRENFSFLFSLFSLLFSLAARCALLTGKPVFLIINIELTVYR